MNIARELLSPLVAISGGLGDIGRAIVQTFQEAGAEVAVADLAPSGDAGDFYSSLDVTDANAVEQWYDDVAARFGRVPNLIIPNAATATFRRHLEITCEEWRREIDVNLNGAYYFARAASLRLLAAGQPGRIVFIGSWAAHAPHGKLPAYSVAKAGLRMVMQTLALELAPRGVLVNEVAPGYVQAGLSGRVFAAQPDVAAAAAARVPVCRLISAEEVARQVLFLCSDDGRHYAGATMLQDGGLSLYQGPYTE